MILNGTYIGPKSEIVLSDDVISLIDKQYFEANILTDYGLVEDVTNNYVMIDTKTIQFYKKPPTGIPKSHLEKEVQNAIDKIGKVNQTSITNKSNDIKVINLPQNNANTVVNDDFYKRPPTGIPKGHLDTDVQKTLERVKKFLDEQQMPKVNALEFDKPVKIIEIKAEEIPAVNTENFYIKPALGIPKTHLDNEVNDLLLKAGKSLQKGNVQFDDLHETLQEIIKSNMTDVNGDGVIDNQTELINSVASLVITEKQLEKTVRDTLAKVDAIDKKTLEKVSLDDLSDDVKYILENSAINESYSFWQEPVSIKELLPIENNKNGDIRLVLKDATFWKWDSDIWDWTQIKFNESTDTTPVPTPSVAPQTLVGQFFAYEGQKRFTASKPFYKGTNNLQVLMNGIFMTINIDYVEIDDNTIEFSESLHEDDYVLMMLFTKEEKPSIYVESRLVDRPSRTVKISQPYQVGQGMLNIFVNGILTGSGEEEDYVEIDSTHIRFNYDLLPGDKLFIRFETSQIVNNITTQFELLQKVYLNLAEQIEVLRGELREKIGN
jgi:hypothetical protein